MKKNTGNATEYTFDCQCPQFFVDGGQNTFAVIASPIFSPIPLSIGGISIIQYSGRDLDGVCENCTPNVSCINQDDFTLIAGGPIRINLSWFTDDLLITYEGQTYGGVGNPQQLSIEINTKNSLDPNQTGNWSSSPINISSVNNWNGSSMLLFTDFEDIADAVTFPDTGSKNDPSTITLTTHIVLNNNICPNNIEIVNSPNPLNTFQEMPFNLQFDATPIGQNYENIYITESFSQITTNVSISEINSAWLNDTNELLVSVGQPVLTSPVEVLDYFSSSIILGGFLIDNNNSFIDTYDVEPGFDEEAFNFSNTNFIEYQIEQNYRCNNTLLRIQTLDFRFNEFGEGEIKISE